MLIHDINGMFQEIEKKIVSSYNALFPALLCMKRKKDIRCWPGVFAINICSLRLFDITLYRNIQTKNGKNKE